MQFQSDMLQCKVIRPAVTETTALGAAYLAGLATGFWKNIEEIKQQWQAVSTCVPTIDEEKRGSLVEGWKKAVRTAQKE